MRENRLRGGYLNERTGGGVGRRRLWKEGSYAAFFRNKES